MEMTEYLRVQRQLMEQIHKGVYRENGKLPTERELCEQFGVSRITIRQALQNMENEGVIVRQQGRGTFVKPRRIEQRLSSIYSFSEDLRKQNIVPGTRMLSMVTIPAQGHIQQKLELGQGVPVRAICRLRLANEMPYAYETSYIPLAFLSDATAEEIAQNGLYNTLRRCSGREVGKSDGRFSRRSLRRSSWWICWGARVCSAQCRWSERPIAPDSRSNTAKALSAAINTVST